MTADEFIAEWKNKKNTDSTPAVGIGIFWDKVDTVNSTVKQFFGEEAWKKMEEFWAPYWGHFTRTTLREWLGQSRLDYQLFIDEERAAGKIDLYDREGLIYPEFCAFTDKTGSVGSMGDGCHRFIDCNYLILNGKDLSADIKKVRLDVLCVPDLTAILSPSDVPPICLKPEV